MTQHQNGNASSAHVKNQREPFVMVPISLRRRTDLTPGAKLLWATLKDYAEIHGNGVAWPGQRRLLGDLGIACWRLRDWTDELVAAGLLQVERGKGRRPNHYRPLDPSNDGGGESRSAPHTSAQTPPVAHRPPVRNAAASAPPASAQEARSAPRSAPERGVVAHRIPDRNQSINQTNKKRPALPAVVVPHSGEEKNSQEDRQRIDANLEALDPRIVGRTRTMLARMPEVTPAIIREHENREAPTGVVVNALKAAAAGAADVERQREARLQRQAEEEDRRQQEHAENALEEHRRELARQIVGKHADEECDRVWTAHLAKQSPAEQRALAGKWRTFPAVMADLLEPGELERIVEDERPPETENPGLEYGQMRAVV